MKIDSGAAHLQATQALQKRLSGEPANGESSFAAIMAEQVRPAVDSKTSAPVAPTEKYDFTNMTPRVLKETVNGLIRSGKMDLDDTSSLLGMMPATPLSKVNYDGTAPAGADTPVNFFTKLQSAIEATLSRNETVSAASLQRAANALARFQI